MTPSPGRALARLILAALLLFGTMVTVGLGLVGLGAGASASQPRSIACFVIPASILDAIVHAVAVVAFVVIGLSLAAAARVFSRERARTTELRRAAAATRVAPAPQQVAALTRALGVGDQVDVIPGDRAFGFVYGWLRPRICVSTALVDQLTDRELEAVLLHEQWHLRQRDPARLLIARMIGDAFGWAPPLRALVDECLLAIEVAADRHAIAQMEHVRWLAGAFMKMLTPPVAQPAFEGLVDARIAILAGAAELPRRSCLDRLIVALLLLVASGFVALVGNGLLTPILGSGLHAIC